MAAALAVLAAAALSAAPAQAYHASRVHWRARQVVVVDKTGNPTWQAAIGRAISNWNGQGITLSHQVAAPGPCSNTVGRVEVCLTNGGGGETRWAYDSTRHFVGVAVYLNGSATAWADALSCHELGHALGLRHRKAGDTASCLTAAVRSSQTRPDSHDLAALRALYNHSG